MIFQQFLGSYYYFVQDLQKSFLIKQISTKIINKKMQKNLNEKQSINPQTFGNTNTGYARLTEDLPPYQPVLIDDTQPHHQQNLYNQPQPYNLPQPYSQNQAYIAQHNINQAYQDQIFNTFLQKRCGYLVKVPCMCVFIQNLLYIIFDNFFSGLTWNYVYIIIILEVVFFGYSMSKISDGMVTQQFYKRVRSGFMLSCLIYALYWIGLGIFVHYSRARQIDRSIEIFLIFIQFMYYLLPRSIVLCVTRFDPNSVLLMMAGH